MRRFLLTLVLFTMAASPAAAMNSSPPNQDPPAALPSSTADHNVNNVATTITDVGAYGYFDPLAGVIFGQGFRFMGFANALFHGGLVMGTSPTTVSDAAYGSDDNGATRPFNFASTELITVASSPAITQYTCASYGDSDFDTVPLGVEVQQSTYAWAGDSYVILDINVTASNPLTGLFVALYTDWDIGGQPTANAVDFDAARKLSSMRTLAADEPNFYGIQLLSHPLSGARAIANPVFVYPNPPVDPGFQDADKYTFFSDMTVTTGPGPNDWSNMVSAGPFNLAAGGSVRVAFAMLAGSTQANLAAQADGAQARWNAGIVQPCGVVPVQPATWGAIKATYR